MKKTLKRGAGWVLVLRDSASEQERNAYGHAPTSRAVFDLVGPRIRQEVCEVLYALHLNNAHRAIGMTEIARGGTASLSASAADVFRAACAQGAPAVVLVHNHPSGDPTPSVEDERFTERVRAAGEVLGIRLVDHVVIAGDRYRSFCDDGKLS